MADARALGGVSLRDEVRSAFTVLGDDEYRRWEDSCRALEGAHEYPWAEAESRALVASVLGCMFGEDLARLDNPARQWAGTNSTMSVFTRRLGCLRELIGQEGVFNGPDATLRVHQIFDRVSIVSTEAALAALTYASASTAVEPRTEPKEVGLVAPVVAPSETTPPSELTVGREAAPPQAGADPEFGDAEQAEQDVQVTAVDPSTEASTAAGHPNIRRRTVVVLLGAAVAALVTSLVFALSSTPVRHHAPRPAGRHPATTTGSSPTSRPGTNRGGTGSGASTARGGPGVSTGGAAHGSVPVPTSPSGTGSSGSGGGSSGSGNPPGGSTGLTLPGGTPLTTPQVTTPGITPPGGSTVTTTNVTLPHL